MRQIPFSIFSRSLHSFVVPFAFTILTWLKMRFGNIPLLGFIASSGATNLYVSSYAGTVTSLQLASTHNGSYSLSQVGVDNSYRTSPAWLEKDGYNGVVYALDEGFFGPNGSIAAFKTSPSGQLAKIGNPLTVISGPVSSVVYNGGKALAVAH